MIYLVVSIFFMSALAVVTRVAVANGAGALGLNTCFRGTAGVIMAAIAVSSLDWSRFGETWAVSGTHGIVAAVFFWFAGFGAIKAVQLGHLGITWTVLRCSMVIATIASLVYWREVPLHPVSATLVCRLAGIALTVAAVVLMGADRSRVEGAARDKAAGGSNLRAWAFWLAAAFLGQGGWEVTLRATRSFPDDHTRNLFVALAFLGTFAISLPVTAVAKAPLGRKEIGYGVLAGVCGLLSCGTRVWALQEIDGVLLFPITTVSVIILVQAASAFVWRERIGRRGIAGLAAAILGMLCLTLDV